MTVNARREFKVAKCLGELLKHIPIRGMSKSWVTFRITAPKWFGIDDMDVIAKVWKAIWVEVEKDRPNDTGKEFFSYKNFFAYP